MSVTEELFRREFTRQEGSARRWVGAGVELEVPETGGARHACPPLCTERSIRLEAPDGVIRDEKAPGQRSDTCRRRDRKPPGCLARRVQVGTWGGDGLGLGFSALFYG